MMAALFIIAWYTNLYFTLINALGDRQRNVVMWMDHRAAEQAARITNTGHQVLSRVGGVMSPEMQPPKLLWLKEVRGEQGHHPATDLWIFLLSLCVLGGQYVPDVILASPVFFLWDIFVQTCSAKELHGSALTSQYIVVVITHCLEVLLAHFLLHQNLKESCWNKAAHFFDLPDFLSWKATGCLTRWG